MTTASWTEEGPAPRHVDFRPYIVSGKSTWVLTGGLTRTALVKGGQAYIQAGGGWVNDSTPEGEYQETVNKAKAMLKAIALAESFS